MTSYVCFVAVILRFTLRGQTISMATDLFWQLEVIIGAWTTWLRSRSLISQVTVTVPSVISSVFSFQNNPKNLDPSYKMNLDFWDCLGRVKLIA